MEIFDENKILQLVLPKFQQGELKNLAFQARSPFCCGIFAMSLSGFSSRVEQAKKVAEN